eukprot:scaffold25913_cov140-Isochrysis_galbana.AAC.1
MTSAYCVCVCLRVDNLPPTRVPPDYHRRGHYARVAVAIGGGMVWVVGALKQHSITSLSQLYHIFVSALPVPCGILIQSRHACSITALRFAKPPSLVRLCASPCNQSQLLCQYRSRVPWREGPACGGARCSDVEEHERRTTKLEGGGAEPDGPMDHAAQVTWAGGGG